MRASPKRPGRLLRVAPAAGGRGWESEMSKWVYSFGGGKAEGEGGMRDLLGGKGANLAEMANLGLPVPPGFTITTEVCRHFYASSKSYPTGLEEAVETALAKVGALAGRKFGDANEPLLVSVRSGARASMPGMMDTVLNLGLNDSSVAALARGGADERFAYDSYRRFIQMYSNVVLEIDHHKFEAILEEHKERSGFLLDTDVISELVKPKPDPKVTAWIEATDESLLHLSVLTLGEIRKGIAVLPDTSRRVSLEAWLDRDLALRFAERILPIDRAVADRWGRIAAQASARKSPLPVIDGLLAATALQHNLTLVTRNTKDVAAASVPVFNPWSG